MLKVEFFSLNQAITPDNEVRLIKAFVNSLAFESLGFKTNFTENGRPPYHPSQLLKLFIYGYLNRIRSSRQLKKSRFTALFSVPELKLFFTHK